MNKNDEHIETFVKGKWVDASVLLDNHKLIMFLMFLALASILSSHMMDTKIYETSRLQRDVRELKSEFVSVRTELMNSRMSSHLQEKVKEIGLEVSTTPPQVIIVND